VIAIEGDAAAAPAALAARGAEPTANSHDWAADAAFGGTWLAPRPGQFAALEALRAAARPVFFAGGDVTLEWGGWIEGAVRGGASGARRAAAALADDER
jgi:monoamine oxidase